jgi:quinol monooxygenase YgiN
MIRYEVNLELHPEIEKEYIAWLQIHMNEMLEFDGFHEAKLFRNIEKQNAYIVHYDIESNAHMKHYLQDHAPRMRNEAIEKFKNKFTASRRIIEMI